MALALLQLQNRILGALPSRSSDRGASLVEYALLLALIAIVCLVAVNTIGGPTSEGLSKTGAGFP